jgi:hypothetical protein
MIGLLRTRSLITLALGLAFGMPLVAAAEDDDPPSRAARLAYTHGSVSFEPAGAEDWVSAVVNRPVTRGDKLWTDRGARAEVQLGSATIHLAERTGFSFLNLTDDLAQASLSEGVISIHLRRLDQNETIELDTPNLAFTLLRPGDYRLEVNEAGDTTVVSVRSGEGEVTGSGQVFTIHSNQRATFRGTDQLTSDIDGVGGNDEFDRWCRDRDKREDRASSARYVSRDVVGYEDLDDYGDWRSAPDYGPIWVPRRVAAGWAPYRYGHWVWISPWGWTWVDDTPWGFAPFHYGRWAFVGGVWGWCPGPVIAARPVYAPALVAWVGGPHFNISIGIGSGVGWFPLGPREVYVPSYRASRTYVTNVNVTNTTVNNTYVTNVYNNYTTNNTNVTNIKYVNRSAPRAVTLTSEKTFASGQPVHKNILKVDQRRVGQAQVSARAGVVPQQRSLVGAASAARAKPPAAVQSRPVVARTAPPPVAFARQQEAIRSNGGQPSGRTQVQRSEPQDRQADAVRVVKPAAKPVPVESFVRTNRGPSGQSVQSAQQAPQPYQNQPLRRDRPPSAQATSMRPQSNPIENQPGNVTSNHPDRPRQSSREVELERKHQQEQQSVERHQEQQRQRLEQDHQRQMQKAQQQAENQRQEQEHQRLEQKQDRQLQNLAQKQQQQRQHEQQRSHQDRPPKH